ncbi:uncharacterized protein Gasu_00330 [Galdieria sulphuraria]|uniref:Uncharacterized protein n=1 Tax=Galdieria sulphuraria TaxID=130081 RepID=M2W9S5_GALSU|nr:uncharacterized protein Gasu_00330 [Galdieria sulphuraria]EME32661.1 hypothetical protein Gasu_00330 [Galdieria sulphuraria]|eukprot:XP_005709181.1 hypothetical protein Gasu_00330 [Galdieria sulphuraria]
MKTFMDKYFLDQLLLDLCVFCSTTSLKQSLGLKSYDQLERIFVKDASTSTDSDLVFLSSAFTYLLQEISGDQTKQNAEQVP